MGWPLIGVLNAGIEILLIIGTGWLFSKFKLLEGDRFMPQANPLMVLLCFPAFNLYRVGITLDLQSADAWRSLSAYMMWIAIIQLGIILYTWLFNKGNLLEAALLNLIFNANNTVIMGLPIMYATTGPVGARVSLLTSVALFLQVTPFSIVAFELDRWLMSQVHEHIERKDTQLGLGGSARPSLRAPKLETLKEGADEGKGSHRTTTGISSKTGLQSSKVEAEAAGEADEVGGDSSSPSDDTQLHEEQSSPPARARHAGGTSPNVSGAASQSPEQSSRHSQPGALQSGDLDLLAKLMSAQPRVPHSVSARQPDTVSSLVRAAPQLLDCVAEGPAAHPGHNGGSGGGDGVQLSTLRRVDDSCASVDGGRVAPGRSDGSAEAASRMGALRVGGSVSMKGLSPFEEKAQHAPAPDPEEVRRAKGRDPWVGIMLQPSEAGLQSAASLPLKAAAQRAVTTSALLDGRSSGKGRRSERVKQIELAHGGHAASINVAELSRRQWVTAYREWHNTTLLERERRLRQRRVQHSLAAVDIPVPLEWVQMDLVPHTRISQYPPDKVETAKRELIDDHGGHIPFYKRFLTEHAQFISVALIVFKNPMLWSLVLALVISVSGLRRFLDPASPTYIDGLGWIVLTLQQIAGITVPLALFSNGVWMYGKNLSCNPVKVGVILVLKVLLLPLLQMGCARAAQLDMPSGLSIVLLSSTPTASTAFVIAAQYAYGCELVTLVTILHTFLLVPCSLLWLYVPQYMGVWQYDLSTLPMQTVAS